MGLFDVFRKDEEKVEPKAPEIPRPRNKSNNELQNLYETYGPEAAIKFDENDIDLWYVRWNARYGCYSGDFKPAVKAFPNEDDAKKFAEILKGAAKLLQYTESINIRVTKE